MTEPVIHHGDCRDVLKTLTNASIDACVCDPPYSLVSLKNGGKIGPGQFEKVKGVKNAARGFMGKTWDTGETAFDPEFWTEVLRVLKPGAHLIAFGGTRTYHRLACAIEDAGFEIRDQIGWLYGSGFPKSHDVSKAIDRAAGVTRQVIGTEYLTNDIRSGGYLDAAHGERPGYERTITVATSETARQWEGWGTALKPAWEPIVLARKPLIGTVAANVLAHGTGAINVDGCRVAGTPEETRFDPAQHSHDGYRMTATGADCAERASPHGRWPANIIHDGSEEVIAAFPETDPSVASAGRNGHDVGDVFSRKRRDDLMRGHSDAGGSAARFFYTAKADSGDRLGSKHPTVKPVDLMAYLCRLVTPPGGTILDPFAGSGTTGMACMREGFDCILIEREAEYVADIRRRFSHVKGEDAPLFTASAPGDSGASLSQRKVQS